MTETTKRPVKTLNANDMEDDKKWLIFVRTESTGNAQKDSWAAFQLFMML